LGSARKEIDRGANEVRNRDDENPGHLVITAIRLLGGAIEEHPDSECGPANAEDKDDDQDLRQFHSGDAQQKKCGKSGGRY
jgi:hypothetical protein